MQADTSGGRQTPGFALCAHCNEVQQYATVFYKLTRKVTWPFGPSSKVSCLPNTVRSQESQCRCGAGSPRYLGSETWRKKSATLLLNTPFANKPDFDKHIFDFMSAQELRNLLLIAVVVGQGEIVKICDDKYKT